jgi:membrane protein
VKRLVERWNDSRPGRTVAWYGFRHGAVLCGGVAYSALFSLFAALAIGWTVFSALLGSRAELRTAVLEQLDRWVPGLVGTGEHDLVSPEALTLPSALTWGSVLAAVVLVFSAMGVMGALRTSVRAMFDLPPSGGNPVVVRLWQLVGFVILAAGVLVSAAASVVAGSVQRVVESLLGGSQAVAWALRLGSAGFGVVLDGLVVAGIVVLVGRAHPRQRELVWGSLAAGVVAGVLRWVGTSVVVGSAARNPLLAPFAAIVTVLVLVNFMARLLMVVCAWMHNPPRIDELARAEAELAARRHAVERERLIRAGRGEGTLWSPVIRGYRRATFPR